MSDKQKDNAPNPPPPPEKLRQEPQPPREPSHDPKVVVTATKGVDPDDLKKRGGR